MLESNSNRDRIISAALRLAEDKSWSSITLSEVAKKSGLPLAELRKEFSSKTCILSGFSKAVDNEILSKPELATSSESARDRIFDVVMTRLETLAPYKPAIRNIIADSRKGFFLQPMSLRPFLCSQYWMLNAAGINAEGAGGLLRLSGLASIYASVFEVWLHDDDPGLAKTMAALDRRLKRGERWLVRLNELCLKCCCAVQRRKSSDSTSEPEKPAPAKDESGPADLGPSGLATDPQT